MHKKTSSAPAERGTASKQGIKESLAEKQYTKRAAFLSEGFS